MPLVHRSHRPLLAPARRRWAFAPVYASYLDLIASPHHRLPCPAA